MGDDFTHPAYIPKSTDMSRDYALDEMVKGTEFEDNNVTVITERYG